MGTFHLTTILLVDDQDTSRVATKWFLNSFCYEVDSARSAEEALALFDPNIHDVVITDNSMPGMSGTELAHVVKLRSPCTPIIMYSGSAPEDRVCLDKVILRPAHLLVIRESIEQLLAPKQTT
jgi:CheY-like chemotaxis protein